MEDDSDDISEYVHAGPACHRCGKTGHKPRDCRSPVLKEKCGDRCQHCIDLTFRREKPVCIVCGKPWAPELVVHDMSSPGSGLGDL